jgi:hypothetical protein
MAFLALPVLPRRQTLPTSRVVEVLSSMLAGKGRKEEM